jgi:hypothetical protein
MSETTSSSKTSFSVIVAGIIVALLFCGLAAFLITQRQAIPTYEDVRKEVRVKNLADLNAANQKALSEYRWVDKAKGIVGLPIDRAMDLVLTELQSDKPHPGGPIAATPAPSAPAAQPATEAKPAVSPEGTAPAASPAPQPNSSQTAPKS